MSQNNRSLSNYISAARRINGYYLQVIGGGLAAMTGLLVYSAHVMNDIVLNMSHDVPPPLLGYLQQRLESVTILFMLIFGLCVCGMILALVVIGQRVGGPTVAIVAYIREMRAGNYDYKRALRKGDELGEIMDELKELARELKARKN
jgi:signal transduction histidine kinase